MASNTPNLNLLKKNPATDGNDTFNVQTMLNDNWDKIDTAVKQVKDKVDTITVPPASTTQAGIVQLTNATNSTSETLAPTAKALKTVSDAALPKTGGTVSGTLSISDPNTTPLMIHSPGNKRWVSHLESPTTSSTTGGRLHISPSKSVDATDWDFDKGIMINSDTGRIKVKNGVEGDFVTYGNRTWLNAQTNLGATPSYTLTLGDSDTGFNWNGDGYFDFKSNSNTAAYLANGRFSVRGDGDTYYDVGNEIRDLKSSGVNYKNNLVAALNANGIAASSSEDWNTLINKINNISTYIATNTTSSTSNLYIPAGKFKGRIDIKGNDSYSGNIGYLSTVQSQRISLRIADANGRDYEVYAYNTSGNSNQGFYIKTVTITSATCTVSGTAGASNPSAFSQSTNLGGQFNLQGGIRFYFVYNTSASSTSYGYVWYSSNVFGG